MGSPAKFTTPVEPRMLSFHSGSSAITIPGKSLTTNSKEKSMCETKLFRKKLQGILYIHITTKILATFNKETKSSLEVNSGGNINLCIYVKV